MYHQGHCLERVSKHPKHFVGYSTGAQVISVVENMLGTYFLHCKCGSLVNHLQASRENKSTSTDNVTSLQEALNGTTNVYYECVCSVSQSS
uniref:Uncharacterized protein n=1 Tax=Physcomitrium patens TaxID=3218 RepID=A0A2K1KZX2_PHYPA|nr:hypothetical protein PHYPA_002110 [Physcomitrium patens]